MKTIFFSLCILLFISISDLTGQDYYINFKGSGESSNVSGVKVENLNQGTTLTIKGTDILHLTDDISSMEPEGLFKNNQILFAPNPTASFSRMQFFLPEDGNTTIDLYNYSGRKVAHTQDLLTRGIHTYLLQGLERGMSIVAIKSGRYSSRGKIVCTSFTNNTTKIIYENTTIIKEQESISMQYNPGDRLKFTGYSGRFSTIVVEVPTESNTIGFDFIACTDADENNYPIVKIGNQAWMAENLRTIRYKNGDLIPIVKDNNIWKSMTGPGTCWYNNDITNLLTYGGLYNWKCVTDNRKVCPAGWHVPTYEEWTTLISFLGVESIAGEKLKETGKAYWGEANSSATNESGFSAIPGGFRNPDGRDTMYFELGQSANWWSSSQANTDNAWYWTSNYQNNTASGDLNNKKSGYSLRCIQGEDQVVSVLSTQAVSGITTRTAISGGNMTSNNSSALMIRGVCWNTSGSPTIEESKTSESTGRRIYSSTLTGLEANTTYYVRAYAMNSSGTAYGNEVSFTTNPVILADLATVTVTSIGSVTALSGGDITDDGGGSITSRGVCWATTPYPTTSDNKTMDGTGTGSYTSNLSELQPGTMYHVRSYSVNAAGTSYGNDLTFTTEAIVPTCASAAISGITTRNAISEGNITSNGGSPVIARGFCWNTLPDPTVADSKTSDGEGNGSFTSNLNSLDANTTYYVRTYAINSIGTAYGDEVTFTSAQVVLAELTTVTVTSISSATAISGGNIINDGGGSIIARGACWAKTSNPTISDNKTMDGTGTGIFTSNLSDLQPGTTYHVRSYSTNSAGTSYGNDLTFTTDAVVPAVLTAAISGITTRTAISGGIITSDGGSPVTARGVCWSTLHNPTTANSKTSDGSGSGNFTGNLNSLEANTIYFVRAYAVNSVGTAYGNEVSFTSAQVVLADLTTTTVSLITSATAISGGNITDDGGGSITSKGVCWGTSSNPTTSDDKTMDGTGTGSFTSNLSGLQPGTTYHVRSYSTNIAGTAYGNDLTFTTDALVPTVSTAAISGITTRTATSGGNITLNGGSPVTDRGVCWSTLHNPTTAGSRTNDGSGNGSFSSNLSSLNANTTYYVRAYAVNAAGTGYGNEVTFTSAQVVLAVLTTTDISSVTSTNAVSGGNITNDGGGSITARGVCWATTSNPTISNNRTTDGTGTGSFTSNLSGLQAGTTYHVRSYSTNSAGTSYGNDLTFTTVAVVPTLSTISILGITQISAISGGNIISNGGSAITARGICWNTLHNPTTANNITIDGSGNGSFTSNLTMLDTGTTYYVKAYATNSAGTAYGNEVSFTTFGATAPALINGLVGYWNLDEASGNALDQMGAHNGIPYAISSMVSGKIGSAYRLSKGSRSYINCGPVPLTINSFSLWAKRTENSNNVCLIGFGNDKPGLWIGSAGNIVLCNNSGVPVATWGRLTDEITFHHLVLVTSSTGTSGKAELYVDGISQGEQTCSTTGIANFVIGSTFAGGAFNSPYSFDGVIDEVGLWDRALTLPEIGELYSQGSGHTYPFTGVVTNEVNFYLMPDEALLLHSVGNKRIVSENIGSDNYLKFSSDNGVSYSPGIIVPTGSFLSKARILENGNIVLFGRNKIYYSDDNLATIHPCNVLDKYGNSFICHIPVNDTNPGGYFTFMGGFAEHSGVAVMGNYTSSAVGASPVNLYYSLDGITWKVFYTFGQNPNYTDDGTVDGGTGGILLGDPDNPVITRHIHSVNFGEDGNFYASTGDSDDEIHILKCSYDKNNDTWSINDLLNENSSSWQRMRTLGIFERNGYYYWGSDGPGTFTFEGVTYQCYGIYKCPVADINDPSKHILLQPLSDACYSFVNVGHIVVAGMMVDDHIYISYDYGETWSSYPKTSWMMGNTKGIWYNELYKYFVTDYEYVFSGYKF